MTVMNTKNRPSLPLILMAMAIIFALRCGQSYAQSPQDNWYKELLYDKSTGSGSVSASYGIAINKYDLIFVADDGGDKIQIYNPNGSYNASITGPFPNGDSFSQPRGLFIDKSGFLFVADLAKNAVFIFDSENAFIQKIGGVTGQSDGQLSGVVDVATDDTGKVYVLERGNARVSIFDNNGNFVKTWGRGAGAIDGYLQSPMSMSIGQDGNLYILQCPDVIASQSFSGYPLCLKVFDRNGNFLRKFDSFHQYTNQGGYPSLKAAASVRVDKSNFIHLIYTMVTWPGLGDPYNSNLIYEIWNSDGSAIYSDTFASGGNRLNRSDPANYLFYSSHAVGDDGSVIIGLRNQRSLVLYRHIFREQYVLPRNSIPMPAVNNSIQRPNSPFIDIDYEVTDADDATVQTGMLVFKSGTQSLANCINNLTLVEGTEANLGTGITSNQKHRVTWNSGADWTTPLADYKVAILAKDSRQKLLDIHYLDLPAAGGIGPLRISRSPLIESDYMQVWWWLLATHDTGIRLDPIGKIYGVGGTYDNVLLCDGSVTPATKTEGRNYIFAKLGVREATTAEVAWAKSGSSAGTGTSTVNVWAPGRQVGGRPKNVNEYGFDTGDWSATSYNARWVISTP